MSALETAVVFLGLGNLAGLAGLVYVVRRLAAWPKPPQQPGQFRRRRQPGSSVPASEHAGAANGTAPAGGTS